MNFRIFIIVAGITVIGGILRFFLLDKYPVQLNHDEISQLYDVISIVSSGKDIYGNFLPLAFPSTGDYKVGHYIYISILPYLIFGMKEITIRIPGAFFGTLVIPAVFLFVNQLTKNFKLALISSAVIAITPSEIFYSRKSFENIIGIFFVFMGLFLLLKLLENKSRKLYFFTSGLFLALPMYLYTAHTIVVPLSIVLFTVFYKEKIFPRHKQFLSLFIFWIILLIPLVFITLDPGVRFRAASVSIFQDANLSSQLQSVDNNLFFSTIIKIKILLEHGFIKYLRQFDLSRVFGNGLDFTNQGLLGMGSLMIWQLPFYLFGIIYILRSFFNSNGKFILGFMLLAMIPSGFTFETYSPHRSVLAFSVMSIISAFGIYSFFNYIQQKVKYPQKAAVFFLTGVLLVINLVYLLHMYTINYPFEKSQNIHYPYKDVALFAWNQYKNFDQIIIDPIYGQSAPVKAVAVHYYLAYYGNYQPVQFQKDLRLEKSGIYFDKFQIREINWGKDQFLKNTLIITSPWSVAIDSIDKGKVIRQFNFYDGQAAFYAIKP